MDRKKKFKPEYFVEPIEDAAHGNAVIARIIDAEPDAMISMRDRRGEPHPVWQATEANAKKLWLSRGTVKGSFRIFKRSQKEAPLYQVSYSVTSGMFKAKKDDPLQGGRVFVQIPERVFPYRDEDIPF